MRMWRRKGLDVFQTRHERAAVMRGADAITELESLIEESRRVRGEEHPETLHARHELLASRMESDRASNVLTEFEALIAVCMRVLGEGHQETLCVRKDLASALRTEGRFEETIEELEQLVEDCRRLQVTNTG